MHAIRVNWLRILTHVGALFPLARIAWYYWRGVFFDPILQVTSSTGKTALVLLILSLACTSINVVFGFKKILRVRRALGLYAFLYASLHGLTFVGWDYGFDLRLLKPAILDQRFVLAGSAAFLLLLLLAITSTRGWQKRLGKHWRRLHRLAYLAGIVVIVHFVWLSKDPRESLWYGAVVTVLLVVRVPGVRKAISTIRRRSALNRQWIVRLRNRFSCSKIQVNHR